MAARPHLDRFRLPNASRLEVRDGGGKVVTARKSIRTLTRHIQHASYLG